MTKSDLADDDLFRSVPSTQEKTVALRGLNPLSKYGRWNVENDEGGQRQPVALIDLDDPENFRLMQPVWSEFVEGVDLNDGFGIAPAVMLLTSLCGPFNSGREKANQALLGQFKDFRIYYTGDWLQPLHVTLFAALLRMYVHGMVVHGCEIAGHSNKAVTVNVDSLVWLLYGQSRSREGNVGGRAQHYSETVERMLKELRLAALTIEECNEAGEEKGYIVNFLRELSWNKTAGTCTFAFDHRIANLFALRRHVFVPLEERHQWGIRVDQVTLDLQNRFRSMKGKIKRVAIPLGSLKIMMGASKWSFKAFVNRVAEAAICLDTDLVNVCTISGYDIHDEIVMIKTGYGDSPEEYRSINLINRDVNEIEAIISKTDGKAKLTGERERKRSSQSSRLSSHGIKVSRRQVPVSEGDVVKARRPSRSKYDWPEGIEVPDDIRQAVEDVFSKTGKDVLSEISYWETYKLNQTVRLPETARRYAWSPEKYEEARLREIRMLRFKVNNFIERVQG